MQDLIQHYSLKIKPHPDDLSTRRAIAELFLKSFKFKNALTDLSYLIENKIDLAWAYENTAKIHVLLSQDDLAINTYSKMIELNLNIDWAHEYIADILYRYHRNIETLEIVTETIASEQTSEETLRRAARKAWEMLESLKQKEQADLYYKISNCYLKMLLDEKKGIFSDVLQYYKTIALTFDKLGFYNRSLKPMITYFKKAWIRSLHCNLRLNYSSN